MIDKICTHYAESFIVHGNHLIVKHNVYGQNPLDYSFEIAQWDVRESLCAGEPFGKIQIQNRSALGSYDSDWHSIYAYSGNTRHRKSYELHKFDFEKNK